jgi:hypothetical protein
MLQTLLNQSFFFNGKSRACTFVDVVAAAAAAICNCSECSTGFALGGPLLRCSITSSISDSFCALAHQSLKECDTLFGGDEVLLRVCRAATWVEVENHPLERWARG